MSKFYIEFSRTNNQKVLPNFSGIKIIDGSSNRGALQGMFSENNLITGNVSFPSLTNVRTYGLCNTFKNCTELTGNVNFPELTYIAGYGLSSAFEGCTNISSINFPKLATIETYGFSKAFYQCTGLSGDITFSKLETIQSAAFNNAFYQCAGITSISFPSLTTAAKNSFVTQNGSAFTYCTNLRYMHFKSSAQSVIKNLTGYSDEFGAPTCTILFDL